MLLARIIMNKMKIELAENEVIQSINEIKYNYSQLDNIIKIISNI